MTGLTLRYEYSKDDDDFGRLDCAVQTANFSGRGRYWMQWQDVAELGEELSEYPIPEGTTLGGVWGPEESPMLAIQIEPDNPTGDLRVIVEISDENDPGQRVRALFMSNYPDLDRFREEIARMMKREALEAVLTGRPE